nr:unnamed protein product [Spirometra erinaceieuropaei]
MWRLCCVLSKKESRITGPQQQQQQQELQQSQLEKPESIQPPAIVTEFPSNPNSPSKTSLRSARKKSNGHTSSLPLNNLLDREETCRRRSTLNFEIDLETGRRPTLVAESTAQLALAESFVLDDLGESRRSSFASVPTAIKPPISIMSGRRRITEEASCTKGDEEETEAEALIPHEDKRAALDPSAIKTAEGTETGREEVMDSANSSSSPRKRTIMVRLRSRGSFRKRSQAKKEGKTISSPSRLGFMSPVWRSVKRTEVSAVPERASGHTEPCAHSHLLQTVVSSSSPNSNLSALPAVCSGCSSSSRRDSLYIFSHTDEAIVTPFAQILASLRKVRSNFIYLTNVQSSKDSRFGTAHGDDARRVPCAAEDEPSNGLATETLEELEWCLERLESVQTHRSVSDMASSKFKKLLNKELNQILDGDKISSQISDYICSTFLDQDESEQAPPAPSDSSNNNNNVSQPNEKSVQNTLTAEKVRRMVPTSLLVRVGSSRGGGGAGSPSSGTSANAAEDSQKTVVVLGARPFSVTVPLQTSATASTTDSAMHSILGVSGSITGVGVDVAKMEQICAIPETSELPPPYGVVPEHPEELTELLENELDQWGMDIFKVADYTAYPLTCVTYTILKQRGLINKFQIPHWNLVRCLQAVECHYSATTPYHNKIHAADVVQSVHVLLQAPALDSVFTDAELTAVIFACAVHDVNHPGVTNQYLVNTNDALAILYNDSSVLENYHLAVAFNLLTYPGCDILANFTRKQRLTFRRMVIDMVLSTDMSKHMSLLADLKTMVETKKVAGSGILNLDNYEDRMQILQNMVHCADLSNTAKPLDLYTRWMNRLMEEFFLQGDRERAAGLDISPMCDRQTATVEKSQVSFIDFISHPLWETWSDLVHPAAQGILELLEYNRNWYFNLIHAEDKTEENNQTIASKQT